MFNSSTRTERSLSQCMYRCSTPPPEPNAPCPNVCIDVQLLHQNRTLLVPMYVSMFNSSTRTERSLSQCMYRCSTPPPEPNAPCPNVCIDVQLLHQNLQYRDAGTFDLVDTCRCLSRLVLRYRDAGTFDLVDTCRCLSRLVLRYRDSGTFDLVDTCTCLSRLVLFRIIPMIEIGFDTSVTFPLPAYTAVCYDFLHTKHSYIKTPRVSFRYIGLSS